MRSTDELVPHTARGEDVARQRGLFFDLLPQPADVDIDRPAAAVEVVSPDALEQLAPREHLVRIAREEAEQVELLRFQRHFAPVAPLNASDLVLVAKAALPQSSLAELIKAAKARPGAMSYASSGPGTPYHMAGELFKAMAGIFVVHIPYRGSAGARTDVLGGQVEMMFDAIPTMSEHVKSGKVKAIATTGRTRSVVLPGVPTMDEAGVPGYEATLWLGVVAPKGTPAAVVAKLNSEIGKITANAEVRRAWAAQGTAAMTMNVDEFTRHLHADIEKWARIVKLSGAKPE